MKATTITMMGSNFIFLFMLSLLLLNTVVNVVVQAITIYQLLDTATVISNGGLWNVNQSETTVIEFETNIAGSDTSHFYYIPSKCSGTASYTISGSGSQQTNFDGSGNAQISITNDANLLNTQTICIQVDLYYAAIDSLEATKEYTFTLTDVTNGQSSLSASTPTSDQFVIGLGSQPGFSSSVAGQSRDGSVTVDSIGSVIYGDVTTVTINGNSDYLFTITSITLEESPYNVDSLSCGSGDMGTESCDFVIPLSYFNQYETVTAIITYDWTADVRRTRTRRERGLELTTTSQDEQEHDVSDSSSSLSFPSGGRRNDEGSGTESGKGFVAKGIALHKVTASTNGSTNNIATITTDSASSSTTTTTTPSHHEEQQEEEDEEEETSNDSSIFGCTMQQQNNNQVVLLMVVVLVAVITSFVMGCLLGQRAAAQSENDVVRERRNVTANGYTKNKSQSKSEEGTKKVYDHEEEDNTSYSWQTTTSSNIGVGEGVGVGGGFAQPPRRIDQTGAIIEIFEEIDI